MKVNNITLTPDNVLNYQSDDVHSIDGRMHLGLHMELNEAIEDALIYKKCDGGVKYAGFLNNLGIEHQTDKGWWNQTAVDTDNMQFFVDYQNGDLSEEDQELVSKAMTTVRQIPSRVKYELESNYVTVSDFASELIA